MAVNFAKLTERWLRRKDDPRYALSPGRGCVLAEASLQRCSSDPWVLAN